MDGKVLENLQNSSMGRVGKSRFIIWWIVI